MLPAETTLTKSIGHMILLRQGRFQSGWNWGLADLALRSCLETTRHSPQCSASRSRSRGRPKMIWIPRHHLRHTKKEKQKMKPTNPNADTYVEERRQYIFVNIRHIFQRTHLWAPWLDTLRWHSCRTPLLHTMCNALVRHSCLTLLQDTLTWHSFSTLLLDALVRHSFLTLFWDALTWRSCKTLLLQTLAWHSCKNTLSWHSCKTIL